MTLPNPVAYATVSFEGLEVLLLRTDANGTIQYVNTAFCRYIGLEREAVVGQPLSLLKKCVAPELYQVMEPKPETASIHTVVSDDARGKMLEVRSMFKNGLVDVVIQDVTQAHRLKQYAQKYMAFDLENFSEDEMRTFRFPERRIMTVSFTDLRGFTPLSEQMNPEEVRTTLNAYLEEVMRAVLQNGGTVDKIIGDEMMSLFGAPRYYANHALRAIISACDQMANMRMLQYEFSNLGKLMPYCGIGLNTGEMVLGNIGGDARQNYTVIGAPVNLASRLCDVAKGGEILLTEGTLAHALVQLPEGWESYTYQAADIVIDPGSIEGKLEEILPLPGELRGKVVLIGPQTASQPEQAQYCFTYLYMAKVRGVAESIPVISVMRLLEGESGAILRNQQLAAPAAQKIFGKYRLLSVIGRGGMGEVWKAHDSFGNVVALKMLQVGTTASDNQVARFQSEAEIMARLPHRSICRIFEVGKFEEISFISMEFVRGATLSEILHYAKYESTGHLNKRDADKVDLFAILQAIESNRVESEKDNGVAQENDVTHMATLPPPQARDVSRLVPVLLRQQTLAIIIKICDGIQFVHEHGVLHRDLKPGNIMVRSDGDPVVMDFGLAKLSASQRETALSISGQIIGTIEYMSPEQAHSSKDVDERADVFSIGAILYEMLTGHRHFQTVGNIIIDAQSLQNYEPKPPSVLRAGIDHDLDIIVLKALRPEKEERYRNVQALRDDLMRYQRGQTISAKPVTFREVTSKWIKRNKALASVLGASVVILLTFGLVFVWSLHEKVIEAQEAQQLAEDRLRERVQADRIAREARERVAKVEKEAQTKDEVLAKTSAELTETKVGIAKNLFGSASSAFRSGNIPRALEFLEKALLSDPNTPDAMMLRGQIAFVILDFNTAMQCLQKVHSNQPKVTADIAQMMDWMSKYEHYFDSDANKKSTLHLSTFARELQGTALEVPFNSYHERNIRPLGEIVDKALRNGNPDLKSDKNAKIVINESVGFVKITDAPNLTNLEPLSNFDFCKELILWRTGVNNLGPLRKAQLTRLEIIDTPIADLTPIQRMPIQGLELSNTKIKSLAPLRGMSIRSLRLNGGNLSDIEALTSLNALEHLELHNLKIDRDPLRKIPPTVQKLVLNSVRLSGEQPVDLIVLRDLPIRVLELRNVAVKDWNVLPSLIRLHSLNLSNTSFNDTRLLEGLPIQTLILSNTKINQLTGIQLLPLKQLDIKNCVVNLNTLAGSTVQNLTFTPALLVGGVSGLRELPGLTSITAIIRISDEKEEAKTFLGNQAVDDFLLAVSDGKIDGVQPAR